MLKINSSKFLLFGLSTFLLLIMVACDNKNTKPGEVVDPWDNTVYHVIRIGEQVWMTDNFQRTMTNKHGEIPNVTDSAKWAALTTPAYCDYDNDPANSSKYGRLYNWAALTQGNLIPFTDDDGAEWVVPTEDDLRVLKSYLLRKGFNFDGDTTTNNIKDTIACKFAKSIAGSVYWDTDGTLGVIGNDLSKNNRTGLNILPGGYRDENGEFKDITLKAKFWSAGKPNPGFWNINQIDNATAHSREMNFDKSSFDSIPQSQRRGLSVRLIRSYKRW